MALCADVALAPQSPANTYGEGFNEAADNLDFLCTMIFTCVHLHAFTICAVAER